MIQHQDHFRRELEVLYGRIVQLKRRKERNTTPPSEIMEEAFVELQTLVEELQVAEEALREQNEELKTSARHLEAERRRYEDLFEAAPDGYIVTDAHGAIREINRAALALLEHEKQALQGRLLTEFMPPEEHPELAARLDSMRIFPAPPLPQSWETRLLPQNQCPVDIALTVSAISGPAGGIIELRWLLRDITEHKQAEALRQIAVLAERNRIAQELHDTLAQGFTGISVQLEAAEEVLKYPLQAKEHLDRARNLARESLAETRRSVFGLRPHELQGGDLPGALAHTLSEVTSGTSLHTAFHAEGIPYPLHASTEDNLLRICQEALTNVLKHAQAHSVTVELSFLPEQVQLCVKDDGNGLAKLRSTHSGGFGLAGMRDRAERIGAEFTLESTPGQGTCIRITLARNTSTT